MNNNKTMIEEDKLLCRTATASFVVEEIRREEMEVRRVALEVEMPKCEAVYALVNLPQMWSMKTDAMKSNDITNTGTGPLKRIHNYFFFLVEQESHVTYTLIPGLSSV